MKSIILSKQDKCPACPGTGASQAWMEGQLCKTTSRQSFSASQSLQVPATKRPCSRDIATESLHPTAGSGATDSTVPINVWLMVPWSHAIPTTRAYNDF